MRSKLKYQPILNDCFDSTGTFWIIQFKSGYI